MQSKIKSGPTGTVIFMLLIMVAWLMGTIYLLLHKSGRFDSNASFIAFSGLIPLAIIIAAFFRVNTTIIENNWISIHYWSGRKINCSVNEVKQVVVSIHTEASTYGQLTNKKNKMIKIVFNDDSKTILHSTFSSNITEVELFFNQHYPLKVQMGTIA
jgi:hypothetical protein